MQSCTTNSHDDLLLDIDNKGEFCSEWLCGNLKTEGNKMSGIHGPWIRILKNISVAVDLIVHFRVVKAKHLFRVWGLIANEYKLVNL